MEELEEISRHNYDSVIGTYGKGKNSIEELMLNFCTQNDQLNFFFQLEVPKMVKTETRASYRLYWDPKSMIVTKAMRETECSTDRYMVRAQVRLKNVQKWSTQAVNC